MKRILFFTILFSISLVSFSQEARTSKGKPNKSRREYNKCVLGIGNYTEKEIVFQSSVTYNWAFNNIENDADKLVLKELKEALASYGMAVKNESVKGNLLLFAVTFSTPITAEQLKDATAKIKVRVKAKNFESIGSSNANPVPEIAK